MAFASIVETKIETNKLLNRFTLNQHILDVLLRTFFF